MEAAAEVERENMSAGKEVLVDLMKRERAPRRAAEHQTGASGPM